MQMSWSRRSVILGSILAVVLSVILLSGTKQGQRLVRDMNSPAFLGMLGVAALTLAVVLILETALWEPRRRVVVDRRLFASQIAGRRWRVERVTIFNPTAMHILDSSGWRVDKADHSRHNGSALLVLVSQDIERWEFSLLLRAAHPSVKVLRNLNYMSPVKLKYTIWALEKLPKTEHGSYLEVSY